MAVHDAADVGCGSFASIWPRASHFRSTPREPTCGRTHQPRQLTHERDRVVGDAWIVPAGRIQSLFDLQLGMVASLPVQDRMDDCAVPAYNDLRECRAKDTLACLPAWMTDEATSRFEISVEPHFPLDVLCSLRNDVDALASRHCRARSPRQCD
jgi:hypothetical protein